MGIDGLAYSLYLLAKFFGLIAIIYGFLVITAYKKWEIIKSHDIFKKKEKVEEDGEKNKTYGNHN
jgi:hypothetical protein